MTKPQTESPWPVERTQAGITLPDGTVLRMDEPDYPSDGIIEVDVPVDAADIECPLCEGTGLRDGRMCFNCGGDGWV